jgi:hypothetical protein
MKKQKKIKIFINKHIYIKIFKKTKLFFFNYKQERWAEQTRLRLKNQLDS